MSWSGRRAVVTGAGGFLGGRLVGTLRERGAQVLPVHRDGFDPLTLARGIGEHQPQVIFHLAGYSDFDRSAATASECMRADVQTTLELLRVLERQPGCALVFTSTLDVYGDQPGPFHEAMREQPQSPYGASKLAAEHLLAVAHRSKGIHTVILRLSTVYGPGQRPPKLIPAVIAATLRGERLPVGAPEQRRCFLYVDDAIDALLRAAGSESAAGETMNVGAAHESTLGEVVAAIRAALGGGPEPDWGRIAPRPGEATSWRSDCNKAAQLIGWRPACGFDEGLAETVRWCLAEERGAERRETR